MLGEDFYFCKLCREAGIDLYIDNALIVPHTADIKLPVPTETLVKALREEWRQPEPLWPTDYKLDPHHCLEVLQGEYDVPFTALKPVVLDIGANVGAFARWAKHKWPEAKVYCFEPHPENFVLLARTVQDYKLDGIIRMNVAISDKEGEAKLYMNGLNRGEWSLKEIPDHSKTPTTVKVCDAANLPTADVLKIDTEGNELTILERMDKVGALLKVKAVMLEFHSSSHLEPIDAVLTKNGFALHDMKKIAEHRGILKYLRK